jgi:hypothetical protein
MTKMDRYRVLVALLVAGLSLLLAGSGADGSVCVSSWSTVPSVEEFKTPRALAALATNDIWVVGSTTATGALSTRAQHWDGDSWSLFPTPNVGTGDNALNGVDGSASDDVWAVGHSERLLRAAEPYRYTALVEHWDGAQWEVVESPNVGTNQYNTLTSR